MTGHEVFFPMGYDDNGLPTAHLVQNITGKKFSQMDPGDFINHCVEVTGKFREEYEKVWKGLGLSIDWSKTYSTNSFESWTIAQKSFIDLFEKGFMKRINDPVPWCPSCETSIAAAEIEGVSRKIKMYDVPFSVEGEPITISTTRPELVGAAVAIAVYPSDERYKHLIGKKAKVPIFGYEVPIIEDHTVTEEFGTGAVMVSTFGDPNDILKWKRHNLDLREVLSGKGISKNLGSDYDGGGVS